MGAVMHLLPEDSLEFFFWTTCKGSLRKKCLFFSHYDTVDIDIPEIISIIWYKQDVFELKKRVSGRVVLRMKIAGEKDIYETLEPLCACCVAVWAVTIILLSSERDCCVGNHKCAVSSTSQSQTEREAPLCRDILPVSQLSSVPNETCRSKL